MPTPSSDGDAASVEDSLKAIALATWNRTRSTDELSSFIERRQSVLADVDLW